MKRTITSEESSLTLVAVQVLIGVCSVKVLINCWTTFSQMGYLGTKSCLGTGFNVKRIVTTLGGHIIMISECIIIWPLSVYPI